MRERPIYLVYSCMDYEYPCEPIKAFEDEAVARAFLDSIVAHQAARPECPVDCMKDLTDEEEAQFDEWQTNVQQPWINAHPGGTSAWLRDGFNVMTIPMESHP